MIAPVLVHLDELFKLRLKIIHRIAGIFLRGGVEFDILRRLGEIGHLRRVGLVAVGRFFALLRVHFRDFFQHGVLLQLGGDQRLEF